MKMKQTGKKEKLLETARNLIKTILWPENETMLT